MNEDVIEHFRTQSFIARAFLGDVFENKFYLSLFRLQSNKKKDFTAGPFLVYIINIHP